MAALKCIVFFLFGLASLQAVSQNSNIPIDGYLIDSIPDYKDLDKWISIRIMPDGKTFDFIQNGINNPNDLVVHYLPYNKIKNQKNFSFFKYSIFCSNCFIIDTIKGDFINKEWFSEMYLNEPFSLVK